MKFLRFLDCFKIAVKGFSFYFMTVFLMHLEFSWIEKIFLHTLVFSVLGLLCSLSWNSLKFAKILSIFDIEVPVKSKYFKAVI